MLDVPAEWLDRLIDAVTRMGWTPGSYLTVDQNVRGLIATLVVCFVCGAMGSLVIGNRMAFFSDALAHSAFAGVGLGLFLCLLTGASDDQTVRQSILGIMVCFGILIGFLITFVREKTELANDTVIGVFFAGAIGLGAVVTRLAQSRRFFSIEDFIFGNPLNVQSWEVILLLALALVTAIFLCVMYNSLVLASANPSLAMSRQVHVRLCRYMFVVLLALMVNLSQQVVGTLLINGLLIVPAAAAANLARNLRQMFWWSIGLALAVGLLGSLLSWEISVRLIAASGGDRYAVGISGAIVVLSVLIFIISVPLGRLLRRA
jgi:zinc transport system permease protein